MQRHCLESFKALDSVHEFSSHTNRSQTGPNLWARFQESPVFYSWKGEGEGCVFLNLFFLFFDIHVLLMEANVECRPWAPHASSYTPALISCFHESRMFLWSIECRGPCLEAALFASYSRKCIFCFKTKPGTSISAIGFLPARIIWWHSPSEFPWRCSRAFPRDGICAELLA